MQTTVIARPSIWQRAALSLASKFNPSTKTITANQPEVFQSTNVNELTRTPIQLSSLDRARNFLDKSPKLKSGLKKIAYPTILGSALLGTHLGIHHNILPEPLILGAISTATIGSTFILEKLIPAREDWYIAKEDIATDLGHITLTSGLFPKLVEPFFFGAFAMGINYLNSHTGIGGNLIELSPIANWHPLALLPLALFMAEFPLHGYHYTEHQNRYLWPGHEIHHSIEQMNTFRTARNHPMGVLKVFPMAALLMFMGFPPEVITMVFGFTAYNGFTQHANIDYDNPKWFDKIIATHVAHRIHHDTNRINSDSNFGVNLLTADHIWGTYKDVEQPQEVGVVGTQVKENDYLQHLIYPLQRIKFHMQLDWKRFKRKYLN